MKENILVIDDEEEIAELIEVYLSSEEYNVIKATSAEEGFVVLDNNEIDLVLLDIMLPGMDGIKMCSLIRQNNNIPIIMISAKTTDVDKILGLNIGADDYITKPFNPLELLARVRSQIRRYKKFNPLSAKADDNTISIREVVINKETRIVTVFGESIKLTPIEFDILVLLASNKGRVFSTDEIFELVWKEKTFDVNNTVMVHIRRLRTKIGEDKREDKIIETVWGVGYKIEK